MLIPLDTLALLKLVLLPLRDDARLMPVLQLWYDYVFDKQSGPARTKATMARKHGGNDVTVAL